LMVRRNKKGYRAIEVANPDFGGAGIEVQGALFIDFRGRIGRRKNLYAELRRTLEQDESADVLGALRGEPGNIDGFDAAGSGNWTLGECSPAREKLTQQARDMSLALAMNRSRRRTHKDMAMLIGFDAIGERSQSGISQ